MTKPLPSPELLRKLLRYDQKTGKLFWLKRTSDLFEGGYRSAAGNCANWNSRWIGQEAFTTVDNKGYLMGRIFKGAFKAHRVIWVLAYGEWPQGEIDHIDGNPGNNKIDNLRDVSHQENMRNQKKRSTNKSGTMGVIWDRTKRRWRADICVSGRNRYLGYFGDIQSAIDARQEAERSLGFSQNHGQR